MNKCRFASACIDCRAEDDLEVRFIDGVYGIGEEACYEVAKQSHVSGDRESVPPGKLEYTARDMGG